MEIALDAFQLPKVALGERVVPDVCIELVAPLFIRERARDRRYRSVEMPTLRHLLRSSMRVAREFFGQAAMCQGRGHFDLDDLAAGIQPTAVELTPFIQEKSSHRSGDRFSMHGVFGRWHFASLPACLVPWLRVGGLLGVGGHRMTGAGRWNLTTEGLEVSPQTSLAGFP